MIYMYIQTQNIVITLLNAIMMDSKGSAPPAINTTL